MDKKSFIVTLLCVIIILLNITLNISKISLTTEPIIEPIIKQVDSLDNSLNKPKIEIITGHIIPNQGFIQALLAMDKINMALALKISNVLKEFVDFRYIVAGEELKLMISVPDGKILQFEYQPNPVTVHRLVKITSFNGNNNQVVQKYDFKYEKIKYPTDDRIKIIEGYIETTLNQALIDHHLQTGMRSVVNNVLNCLVSFRTDARRFDKFKVMVKERFYQGKLLKGGQILYASYDGKRTGFKEAFNFFDNENSAFNAHYSPKGKALIASSLRLPLDKIHVTSSYGYRIHPITGRRAFHNGVDYRARTGTPVYAVARGKVIKSTRNKLSGKYIVLKHDDGTLSYYLHLSKRLTRKGQFVRPRQKIGLAGRTGRVSGPHLHFGLKRKGKWKNPLRVRMIATPQLKGNKFKHYQNQVDSLKGLLKKITLLNSFYESD